MGQYVGGKQLRKAAWYLFKCPLATSILLRSLAGHLPQALWSGYTARTSPSLLRPPPKITLIWNEHLWSSTPQASLVLTGWNSRSPGDGWKTHSGGTEPAPPTCWEPRLTRKPAFQQFSEEAKAVPAQGGMELRVSSCNGCVMCDPAFQIRHNNGTQSLRRFVFLSPGDEGRVLATIGGESPRAAVGGR